MFLYLYDIKTNSSNYNRVKRRFYYGLRNSDLGTLPVRTKSVILIPDDMEHRADAFFLRFKGDIELYKAKIEYIKPVFSN